MFQALVRILQIPARPLVGLFISGTVRTRVLIICGEEVLLVRGWIGSERWNMPGGGLKKDEKPELGALRELQEEVGFAASQGQLKFLRSIEQKEHHASFTAQVFLLGLDKKPSIKIRRREIIEAKWFKARELPNNLNPIVKTAIADSKN